MYVYIYIYACMYVCMYLYIYICMYRHLIVPLGQLGRLREVLDRVGPFLLALLALPAVCVCSPLDLQPRNKSQKPNQIRYDLVKSLIKLDTPDQACQKPNQI